MKIKLLILLVTLQFSCKNNIKKPIVNGVVSVVIDTIPPKEIPKQIPDSIRFKGLTNDFVLGKFNYRKDRAFVKVDRQHSNKVIYLQKQTYDAFLEMLNEAKKEGIDLTIISGTRNFNAQRVIWNRKWEKYKVLAPKTRALKILEYSSMPSTLRHHWGTDMDLNNLNNVYFESGKGLKEYNWLVENAFKYGFFQPYTSKENGRKGYEMEKWHWSYQPLSGLYLDYYNMEITYNDITGFSGFEFAKDINSISDYVNGIDKN